MPAKKLETVSVSGVEVLSTGTWNGDIYDQDDLDAMVECFASGNVGIVPPAKLGHNKDQKMLQADGLPAAGYITNLYRDGKKLYADLRDVPKRIADLVNVKAYSKVSSEVFFNVKDGKGKRWPRVFAGLALLGADLPAVTSIADIEALYGAKMPELQAFYTAQADPAEGERHEYDLDIDMSLELRQERVRQALRQRFPQSDSWAPWPAETYSDRVIFEQQGKYYQIDYSLREGAVMLGAQSTEVLRETVWRPLSAQNEIKQLSARIDHLKGEKPTPAPIQEDVPMKEVLKLLGLAEDADEATVAAKVKELQDAQAKPGEGQYSQTEFRNLQNQVGTLTAQLAAQNATAAVEDAIRVGKVLPAQREWATNYARNDGEGFKAYIEVAQTFPLGAKGKEGNDDGAPGSTEITEEEKRVAASLGLDTSKLEESKKRHLTAVH